MNDPPQTFIRERFPLEFSSEKIECGPQLITWIMAGVLSDFPTFLMNLTAPENHTVLMWMGERLRKGGG